MRPQGRYNIMSDAQIFIIFGTDWFKKSLNVTRPLNVNIFNNECKGGYSIEKINGLKM